MRYRLLHPKTSSNIDLSFESIELTSDYDIIHCKGNSVSILFTGDLMPFGSSIPRHSAELNEFIDGADYVVFNLEGVLTHKKRFLALSHHPRHLLMYLKSCFSNKIILNVANNHSADFGRQVFQQQNDLLRDKGFLVVGDTLNPLTLQGNINLYAMTFLSNQDPVLGVSDVSDFFAHAMTCPQHSYNIIMPHWGMEMHLCPSQQQINFSKSMVPSRFDSLIGNHSHTPQPINMYRDSVIATSLGNFCYFNHNPNHWFGALLKLTLCNDDLTRNAKPRLAKLEVRYTKQRIDKDGVFIDLVERPNYLIARKETTFFNFHYLADILK